MEVYFSFYGQTANIIVKQSGYIYFYPNWGTVPVTDYQKFKVTTKTKKYKLKTIKAFLFNIGEVAFVKTYKGYGKNSLTAKLYGTYEGAGIYYFKILYY